MQNSLILLVIALVLLWLAVTDKLSRLLDAWDVITGKTEVKQHALAAAGAGTVASNTLFELPSLPTIGNNAQVSA